MSLAALENIKTFSPLLETAAERFLASPSIVVTPEMKQQLDQFMASHPRGLDVTQINKRVKKPCSSCEVYRGWLEIYSKEIAETGNTLQILSERFEQLRQIIIHHASSNDFKAADQHAIH